PMGIVEKVWNFPFIYPIPTAIPGLSVAQKDEISRFQKESSLDGQFSALIESESSRFNINSVLADYPDPKASPSPRPSTNPYEAISQYLQPIFQEKMIADQD